MIQKREQQVVEMEMDRQQRRKSRRRQEILTVAARFFAELGYERTTFEMIANELGLSQPALYYYVTKKEDILAQLLEDILQRIMDRVRRDISASMPANQKLIRLIKAHVAGLCRYPEGKAFILYDSHLLSQRLPEILAVRDQYQHLLESILQEGVEQGLFHIEDVKLTALAFLGALNWIPRWFAPDGRLSSEMIGDSYARLFMRALVMPDKASPGSSTQQTDEQQPE